MCEFSTDYDAFGLKGPSEWQNDNSRKANITFPADREENGDYKFPDDVVVEMDTLWRWSTEVQNNVTVPRPVREGVTDARFPTKIGTQINL